MEPKRRARKRKQPKKPASKSASDSGKPKGARKASGTGAVAMLARIYDEGFFSEVRTINDIVEHCGTNLARKIKSNEVSGKLGRMVRDGDLTRKKNKDGQYEYKKA